MREGVLQQLTIATQDADYFVRWQALGALGEFGPAALASARRIAECVERDADDSVRWKAAEVLGAIDQQGQIGVPVLIQAMNDPSASVRRFSAKGLGKIGFPARQAAPTLLHALQDIDCGVRVAAAESLWKVDQNAVAAVPVLIRELQEQGGQQRWAAHALASIGPAAQDAVPALRKLAMMNNDASSRQAAVMALGNIGPGAAAAVPDLTEFLEGKPWYPRVSAALALWKINQHPRALPILVAEATRCEQGPWYDALRAVGEVGPATKEAIPAVTKGLTHRRLFMRQAAAQTLKQIAPEMLPPAAPE